MAEIKRIDGDKLAKTYDYRLVNQEKIDKATIKGFEIDTEYSTGEDTTIGQLILMRRKIGVKKVVEVVEKKAPAKAKGGKKK